MQIDKKLEHWQTQLLDLTNRNRLINCPIPNDEKRTRNTLLINIPNPTELWKLLVEKDQKIVFPLPPDTQEEDNQKEQTETSKPKTNKTNPNIKVNQTPNEMNKTLRNLKKKAHDFTEEKGLNALHLAFGFLNWKENRTDGKEMRSPLLLLPVELSQEDLFSPIILSRSDEEIVTNHSLEQKLLNDFNIELPPPQKKLKLTTT